MFWFCVHVNFRTLLEKMKITLLIYLRKMKRCLLSYCLFCTVHILA